MTTMASTTLEWTWRGNTIRLAADACGSGPKLLLLPALSSISTRREMRPLQERLAARYSTLAVDWPGFGEAARPQVDWTPDAYTDFLAFVLSSVMPHPHAIIAAGHTATYVLKHAASTSEPTARLVLIAPTWRGPLPTMAGGHRPLFDRLCRLVDVPALGPLVYRLNVNRLVVRYMGAGHVYSDPAFLNEERLRQKLAVITESSPFYASSDAPWGSAIIPMEMLSVLFQYRAKDDPLPTKGPAVGLFADQEIRLLKGPLFVDQDYEVEREVVALSGSRRSESAWVKTRVFDPKDGTPVATMLPISTKALAPGSGPR